MIGVLTNFLKLYIMLKNILKFEGAVELTKSEKRSIKGGLACIDGVCPRPGNHCCPTDNPTEFLCRMNGQACLAP